MKPRLYTIFKIFISGCSLFVFLNISLKNSQEHFCNHSNLKEIDQTFMYLTEEKYQLVIDKTKTKKRKRFNRPSYS